MQFLLLFIVLIFSGCSTHSQNRSWERIALIVANEDYKYDTELTTPILAAKKLQKTLKKIGFKEKNIFPLYDATFEELDAKLKEVKSLVSKYNRDNLTLLYIYYAGHGHTEQNRTAEAFLEMVDPKGRVFVSNYYLYDEIIRIKADYNVISIDACLNLKANEKKKAESKRIKGESKLIPNDTIISYATGFTQLTHDEGVYTKELIKGLELETDIQTIFNQVERETKVKIGQAAFRITKLTFPLPLGKVYRKPLPMYPR